MTIGIHFMKKRFLLLWLIASVLLPCAGSSENHVTLKEADLLIFQKIAQGIRNASSFSLYEGLPHQTREQDLLKQELAEKKVIRLRGFPFYERPLAISPDDSRILRELACDAGSFKSYSGPKRCGGFHPDYALAWKDGDAAYHLLVCFGCHEMKLYSPTDELYVDIQRNAFSRFESLLKKYRSQRPKGKV